jgi:hypothetical protein
VFPTVIILKYLHRVKILFHFLRQLERRYVSFILQVGICTALQQVMHGRQVISFYRFMQSGIAVGIQGVNHRAFSTNIWTIFSEDRNAASCNGVVSLPIERRSFTSTLSFRSNHST